MLAETTQWRESGRYGLWPDMIHGSCVAGGTPNGNAANCGPGYRAIGQDDT